MIPTLMDDFQERKELGMRFKIRTFSNVRFGAQSREFRGPYDGVIWDGFLCKLHASGRGGVSIEDLLPFAVKLAWGYSRQVFVSSGDLSSAARIS